MKSNHQVVEPNDMRQCSNSFTVTFTCSSFVLASLAFMFAYSEVCGVRCIYIRVVAVCISYRENSMKLTLNPFVSLWFRVSCVKRPRMLCHSGCLAAALPVLEEIARWRTLTMEMSFRAATMRTKWMEIFVSCLFCVRSALPAIPWSRFVRMPMFIRIGSQKFNFPFFFVRNEIERNVLQDKQKKHSFDRFEPIVLHLCKLFIYIRKDILNPNTYLWMRERVAFYVSLAYVGLTTFDAYVLRYM